MNTRSLSLELLDCIYAVVRVQAGAPPPPWATEGPFVSITRTEDELSVVCPQQAVPADTQAERGWRCLRVAAPGGLGQADACVIKV